MIQDCLTLSIGSLKVTLNLAFEVTYKSDGRKKSVTLCNAFRGWREMQITRPPRVGKAVGSQYSFRVRLPTQLNYLHLQGDSSHAVYMMHPSSSLVR